MTSSTTLSNRLTSSRARSSVILFRSRSSSIALLLPGKNECVYRELLCQLSSVVATHEGIDFQPRIIEVTRRGRPISQGTQSPAKQSDGRGFRTSRRDG